EPEVVVKSLCHRWGLLYSSEYLHFKHEFGDFIFNSSRERTIYTTDNAAGIFKNVKSHRGVRNDIKSHGLLVQEEIDIINKRLMLMYLLAAVDAATAIMRDDPAHYSTQLEAFRKSLLAKPWWGFDLDDTLHYFRNASGKAASAVFDAIHATYPSVSTVELKNAYGQILRAKTAPAFTDGRSSTEYRRERFGALLDAFGITPEDSSSSSSLAEIYRLTLRSALSLRPGALALLQLLKTSQPVRKVVIITEGPLDAQSWTLDALGLTPYVDVLATSGGMQVSKTDGLFEEVFRKYEIVPEDMVFIGDSMEQICQQTNKSNTALYIRFDVISATIFVNLFVWLSF
ncbi:hypothetical protein EJ07DRAFT_147216, partial [Lizonia empirigonia]